MGRLIDVDKFLERVKKDREHEIYLHSWTADMVLKRLDSWYAPTVEAIPKDQYETRLKADLVAILDEFDLRLYEQYEDTDLIKVKYVRQAIQQKINALNDGNIITNIDKFKEVFANLPVSLDTQKRLVIDDSNAPYGFWEQEYKKEEKK